ncbi:MAG: hypothetical protein RSE16_03510 [Sphingobium sp.]|nr:MAG: hypothetical protein RSE16_03510 [Sphingobium sp.]
MECNVIHQAFRKTIRKLLALGLSFIYPRAVTLPMLSGNNIGCGEDVSIIDLAKITSQIAKCTGQISFETLKPDGTPRKLMEVMRLTEIGHPERPSRAGGIADPYRWLLTNQDLMIAGWPNDFGLSSTE